MLKPESDMLSGGAVLRDCQAGAKQQAPPPANGPPPVAYVAYSGGYSVLPIEENCSLIGVLIAQLAPNASTITLIPRACADYSSFSCLGNAVNPALCGFDSG